jgi:hypothetical protein
MPFENLSKRKLAFAPKIVIVPDGQADLTIALNEVSFVHTQRITAPGKMIEIKGVPKAGEFEKLPELVEIQGHLSVPDGMTVLAAKLTRIDGDLHVGTGARFYAPALEAVTGFIYLGDRAVVNAPKVEPMLANDDTSKIQEQKASNWLDSLAL